MITKYGMNQNLTVIDATPAVADVISGVAKPPVKCPQFEKHVTDVAYASIEWIPWAYASPAWNAWNKILNRSSKVVARICRTLNVTEWMREAGFVIVFNVWLNDTTPISILLNEDGTRLGYFGN